MLSSRSDTAPAPQQLAPSRALELGVAAAKAGDRDEARRHLSEAVATDPASEIAWIWLASVADSPSEAISALRTALSLGPTRERTLTSLKNLLFREGTTAAQSGDRERAHELLEECARLDPGNERVWLWLASTAASPHDAIGHLRRTLQIDPSHSLALTTLRRIVLHEGITATQAGDIELAREYLSEAATVDPLNAQVWTWLAQVSPSPDERVRALERALEIDPSNERTRLALATLRTGPSLATDRHHLDAEALEAEALAEAHAEARAETEAETHDDPAEEPPADGPSEEVAPEADVVAEAVEVEEALDVAVETDPAVEAEDVTEAADPDVLDVDVEVEAEAEVVDGEADVVADAEGDVVHEVDTVEAVEVGPEVQTPDEVEAEPEADVAAEAGAEVASEAEVDVQTPVEVVAEPVADAAPASAPEELAPPAASNRAPDRSAIEWPETDRLKPAASPAPSLRVAPTPAPTQPGPAVLAAAAWPSEEAAARPADTITDPVPPKPRTDPPPAPAATAVTLPRPAAPKITARASVRPTSIPGFETPVDDLQAVKAGLGIADSRLVMVVDDSPTIQKVVSVTLERYGHRVLTAKDGVDALEKLEGVEPDLILLDITMPRMDGYTLCKTLRAQRATRGVPVVMLSGKDGFFDKVRGRMAGATDYITKPFAETALVSVVDRYAVART